MDCKEYTVADIGRGRMSNMEFAKRMDRFGAGIFSKLAEIKKEKTATVSYTHLRRRSKSEVKTQGSTLGLLWKLFC